MTTQCSRSPFGWQYAPAHRQSAIRPGGRHTHDRSLRARSAVSKYIQVHQYEYQRPIGLRARFCESNTSKVNESRVQSKRQTPHHERAIIGFKEPTRNDSRRRRNSGLEIQIAR
ncbi:uncharacterized protein LOC125230332 [Leguminivora glycinivorella]|uniref:uncharacterized protein LOC125230332 n=1 Tax=Leguminivora glycinivorella TaxID=1035111 RepID=UPI00200FE3C1|nr:uncharacterized protein LOC125230332 [Leguminivora glycinivorella]